MSTPDCDDNESSGGAKDESTDPNARSGANADGDGGGKVVFLLKAAGGAPILKRRKWALPRTKTMGHIVEFLKKYIKLDPQEHSQLFLYVNQSFAPALDTTIGSVNDCFSSEGTLVLHYALTQAWG